METLPENADYSKLSTQDEYELIKLIANFQNSIFLSIERNEPSVVTRHIIEIAKAFNKFYNLHSVLNVEDEELKKARIKLVEATCQVIKNGLGLLGIDVVEKM